MPPSFTSHFSPPPIRPATTPLLPNLNLAPTLTPLPTRKRHRTLTPNLNSRSLQPITPTNSTAQKRKPRITTFLPNRVGVMSKYSDTPNKQNHDFPEPNPSFTTHERRSTPTQNFNLCAAHLMPQVSRRSSPRVGFALGYPNKAVPRNREFPAENPTLTRPTCWFTPTRNFDFCAPLRFNSVPFAPSAPCSLPVLFVRSRLNLNRLHTVVPLMTRSTPATRVQEIARHPLASFASFCSKKRQRVTQRGQPHLTPMITSPNSPENQMSKRSLDTAARFKADQASSFWSLVLGHWHFLRPCSLLPAEALRRSPDSSGSPQPRPKPDLNWT
jgi:hypothetical protein